MRTCLKQNTFIVTKNNFSFPLETFITDEYYEADDDDNNNDEDLPEFIEGNEEGEELFDDEAFFHEQNDDIVDNSNDDDSDSSLSSSSNSSISSAALKDGKGNPSVDFQGTKQQMMIAMAAKTASEEAQQLQRTTSVITKRSTEIAGFEVKESKSFKEFESAEYVSQDSIARAIMKPCCTEDCLRKKLNTGGGYSCLNFESVYSKILAARKHLFGNEFKDKVTILKAIIQGTLCSSILHYFY